MKLKKLLKDFACFLPIILNRVEASEIEIRLVVSGSDGHGCSKFFLGLCQVFLPDVEHAKVVESFGIIWAYCDCALEVLSGSVRVVLLCEEHSEAVLDFGVVGTQGLRTGE